MRCLYPATPPPSEFGIQGNSGAAQYSINLAVPRGIGSLAPSLTLRYSSDRGDGPFGYGWDLEFGEIRRSTRYGQPVYSDTVDQFEFAGHLLVANPAESTGTTTRYHTLTETFFRIVHVKGGGEDRWDVTRPDGTHLRFGATNASRVKNAGGAIFRWMLDEMEDAHGNIITFEHLIENGEAFPRFARYTMRGSSLTPVGTQREVEFQYQTRLDPSLTFMGGVRRTIGKRVDRIVIRTGTQVFRTVELHYADEPSGFIKVYQTGRSRLAKVQFSGTGDTSDVLPPMEFEYRDLADIPSQQGTGNHWVGESAALPAGLSDPNGLFRGVRIAKVNPEDGYPDLIVAGAGPAGFTRGVYLGTGSGWNTQADPT